MACLEVVDVPSGASSDDLGLLVAQFAPVRRMLLLSSGPGMPGCALVWLEESADLTAAADVLDCHPLAGGLISVKLCDDPMRWVVNRVGSDQLLRTTSSQRSPASAPAVAAPVATPPMQAGPTAASLPPPPAAATLVRFPAAGSGGSAASSPSPQLPPSGGLQRSVGSSGGSSRSAANGSGGGASQGPASAPSGVAASGPSGLAAAGSGGVAAMEAELRELQEQLRQQALAGQLLPEGQRGKQDAAQGEARDGGGGGWEWGSGGGGGAGSDEDAGWQQAGPRGGGSGAGAARRSASREGNSRILVHNIDPGLEARAVKEYFKQFGWVSECIKFRDSAFVFVHFDKPAAAAAAIHAVHGRVVPELNPVGELTAEYREQKAASSSGGGGSGRQSGSGWATASESPTTKLWVGNVHGQATVDALCRVFGRFGPVFALELRRAPEAGRKDQWGFVNFRRLEDAQAAYAELRRAKVPELSGALPLKLQYRPV